MVKTKSGCKNGGSYEKKFAGCDFFFFFLETNNFFLKYIYKRKFFLINIINKIKLKIKKIQGVKCGCEIYFATAGCCEISQVVKFRRL